MTEKRNLPVAVFDSGVGGISVLRELVRCLPKENFYFFGDSIHAPYGVRPEEEIRKLTMNGIAGMYRKGIKAVVVACNTATSAAIRQLRERYRDIPVVGIEPALKPAVLSGPHPRVLVLATPLTVAGDKFLTLMHQYEDRAQIMAAGCPGLMEFVEAGRMHSPQVKAYLQQLLAPYLDPLPDAIVLGCTHYPFLREDIRQIVGEQPKILDGSEGTARELARRLEQSDLLTDRKEKGKVFFENSAPGKIKLCEKLLNEA